MPLILKQMILTTLFLPMFFGIGCVPDVPDMSEDPSFPLEPHILYPTVTAANGQVAAGGPTGQEGALDQPRQAPRKERGGATTWPNSWSFPNLGTCGTHSCK